ncbi:PREDICTED: uncharacterized protein LOC106749627 [Dinoponera quadriceps]|uniref:Uncharacterized protein LOC106749627 n=1 Tax=Dinoponera quadriceps TaxID=609295 RepID=A0A6P3Y3F1_DINQU|nr:PREDICTED: uncharacterized protein LOC106749627 [Dinoponera quadriceps]
MSVFTQKLSRLRCSYSTLLRLSNRREHPQWLVASLSCRRLHLVQSSTQGVEPDDRHETVSKSEIMGENDYAHRLFLNSYKYAKSMMLRNTAHAEVSNEKAKELLEQDWSQKIGNELLSAVKKLSYNISYNDERIDEHLYKNAFVAMHNNHQKLNDQDLITLTRYLVPFCQYLIKEPFCQQFYKQLNLECVKRFMNLSVNNMLALCDTFYEMAHSYKSEYIWYAIRKLGNKPQKLAPHHLIQVLFFLNVCRKLPINMYELEYHLEQCFDELTINEVGVAALGFFKTGTKIKSHWLLSRLMTRTIAELNYTDTVSIGAIAKLIRYSMQLTEINKLKELIDAIVPIESRLTLMTLNHIAHASTRVSLYHEELINTIIKRLNNELTTARIKDFERLIFYLTCFNVDPNKSVYHNVIQELRAAWYTSRAQEIQQFPYVISRLLIFLSYVNLYPTDLIERVMASQFIHNMTTGKYYLVSQGYMVLDYSLQVEVPEYSGPFLREPLRDYLFKRYFLNFKSAESSRANILLTHVLQTCQEMFNNTSDILVDQLLPHFMTRDITFALDEQNRLVSIKDYMSKFEPGEIKRISEEDRKNIRWIVLIMGYQGVLIKHTNETVTRLPIGLLAARIRQLAKIGYTPILVSHVEWEKCETQEERYNYIRQLLFQNDAPE